MGKVVSRIFFFPILLSIVTILPSCQYIIGERNALPVLSENNLPIVKIDNDHDWINLHTNNDALEYKIPAGNGLILNASGYKFQIPTHLATFNITEPNRIIISIRLGHYISDSILYYADWNNNETSIALASETLIPLQYITKPFIGFESGQELELVIGFFDKSGKTTNGAELFYPFWGSSVYVQ